MGVLEIRNLNSVREELLQTKNTDEIEHVCDILRGREKTTIRQLAKFVAALCNVNVDDMISQDKSSCNVHARWLFWYSCRYMTNESCEKIAIQTSWNGHRFSSRAVQFATNRISELISRDQIWEKRWFVVKNIIKSINKNDNEEKQKDNTIVISIPKGLKEKLNIQIKEK